MSLLVDSKTTVQRTRTDHHTPGNTEHTEMGRGGRHFADKITKWLTECRAGAGGRDLPRR